MNVVFQCPKCDLRFAWKSELESHCSEEHPTFNHDYFDQHSAASPPPPAPQRKRQSTSWIGSS